MKLQDRTIFLFFLFFIKTNLRSTHAWMTPASPSLQIILDTCSQPKDEHPKHTQINLRYKSIYEQIICGISYHKLALHAHKTCTTCPQLISPMLSAGKKYLASNLNNHQHCSYKFVDMHSTHPLPKQSTWLVLTAWTRSNWFEISVFRCSVWSYTLLWRNNSSSSSLQNTWRVI